MMGDDSEVRYNSNHSTRKTFYEILSKADDMKSSYPDSNYHAINRNCRDFVRELGHHLDPSFQPIDATRDTLIHTTSFGLFDPTFPNGRNIK